MKEKSKEKKKEKKNKTKKQQQQQKKQKNMADCTRCSAVWERHKHCELPPTSRI